MINSKGNTPIIVSFSTAILSILFFSKTVTSTGYSPENISINQYSENKEESLKIEEETKKLRNLAPEQVEQEKVFQDIKKTKKGDNFYSILKGYKLSFKDIQKIVLAAKPFSNIKKIPVGTSYSISHVNGEFKALLFDINIYNTLSVKKEIDGIHAEILPVEFETRVTIKEVTIKDNLFNLAGELEESSDFSSQVADIFSSEIDFVKDIKTGDKLKAAIEKRYRDGNFVEYGKVLGAEFINNGKKHIGIYFEENNAYYDLDGKPLTKQFLKNPLRFTRISSTFSMKRFHPILKRRTPHFGVDYVAPIGTPVHAVADGVVTFSNRKGPSGNLVYVKHDEIYTTGYSHLNSFAVGIQVGSIVKQGDVIGYVGMTGRATGPHLDFQIRENGTPIDPLKFKSPDINPISENQILAFSKTKNEVMALLDGGTPTNLVKVAMR